MRIGFDLLEKVINYERKQKHTMISEGDSVPKFEANDSNGNKVKSSDFKGRKHVVYFYPKDFTPGCN